MKQFIPKLYQIGDYDKENMYLAPKHTRVQSSLALREKQSNSFHTINPLQKPLFRVQRSLNGDQDDHLQRIKTDSNIPQPLRNGRNLSITSGVATVVNKQFIFPNKKVDNPQIVSQYRNEIVDHLRNRCTQEAYKMNAFSFQIDVTEKMRGILFDWLVDVHHKFKLDQETLFITISIIDRVLEIQQISKSKFQLYGVTALFIAAKYEEVYSVPHVRDLVYVCDNAYPKEEILDCEGKIIQLLKFEILTVSPYRLLNIYQETAKLESKNYMLARYMIELALLDYSTIQYTSNQIASSAIYLVNKIRRIHPSWGIDTMQPLSGLAEQDIRNCAKDLCSLLQNQDRKQFNASRKKYSLPKYLEVARIRIEKKNNQ